ncbi:hypothetical protein HYV89_03330 [Candidatus Woesearchaeota archaeon]|nr:hypothetical protein [Candidatus Woesearchaeota archaeon]
MSRFKALIIILVLFFVMGQSCKIGGKKNGGFEEDDLTGTKGLVLSFVDGLPPKEIWKGVEFGILVDVHNQGVNDVKNGRVCVSSLPSSIFTKSDSCLEFKSIAGRRNFPGGEIQTYGDVSWDGFSLKESYAVPVDSTYPISAKACYEYSTTLSPLVCIRDLRMNEREVVCETGEIKVPSSQGAPVSVTSLKEDIVPRGSENELFFTLKIRNTGDGDVIKTGVKNEECRFIERKDKDLVNVEVELPGFGKGNCKNDGNVVLINGEGLAFCSGIKVPKGESFSLPLNIKLTYGYLSHIRGEFIIKKDIVEAK